MNGDERDFEDAVEARLATLGTRSPRCSLSGCRETNPFALTGVEPSLLCYEHAAQRDGRSPIEDHHPAGRANDPETAVPLPGNDHRVISARMESGWDLETLRNPDGSPLLRAASAVRGWLEVLRHIIDRSVGWVPKFLEQLDAHLRERVGARWWDDLGWQHT